MHPAAFDYHRPDSLGEALDLLSSLDDARPLAGGQSLLPAMKMRLAQPAALVDLARIGELAGIRREGGELVVGAMTRYADVLGSADAREASPLLVETVRQVGDRQVRNVGTLGGSAAHADPAADLPAALVALGAVLVAAGPDGERRIPARDFFPGMFTTALRDGEVLTAIRVPVAAEGDGGAYAKHRHPASGYAVAGVGAFLRVEDGTVADAAVAVGGVTGGPVLAEGAAEVLRGRSPGADTLREAAEAVAGALESAIGDTYASGEYRVHLATILARRALSAAAARAGG